MPFILHAKDETLSEDTAAHDYLKWLEDADPAEQEERQALQVMQNAASFPSSQDRGIEPWG